MHWDHEPSAEGGFEDENEHGSTWLNNGSWRPSTSNIGGASGPWTEYGGVAQVSKPAVSPDFQVGNKVEFGWPADLEIRDTADLEVCATLVAASPRYKSVVHERLIEQARSK